MIMSGKDVNDFDYIVISLSVVIMCFIKKILVLWTLSIVIVLFEPLTFVSSSTSPLFMGIHLTITIILIGRKVFCVLITATFL